MTNDKSSELENKKTTASSIQPMECQWCRKVKHVPRTASVGDLSKSSGFSPVFRCDTVVLWFCPVCVRALRPHIQVIVNATSGENIYWPHMMDLLSEVPNVSIE